MKIDPKIAVKSVDLEKLKLGYYKNLMRKKVLTTFVEETSKEKPTDFIIMADYSFTDKPKIVFPLLLLGN